MEAINLDLLPGAIPPTVHVSQGDVGRQFKIALYDDTGAAYSLTGKTLTIVGHKCDGNVFQYAIPSESISGNEVTITTEEQMTPVAGKAICEINIEQNDTKLGTCNFVMNVEKGPFYMGPLSKSELSIINALVEQAHVDAEAAAMSAATATQKASEASSSATAAAGSASTATTEAGNASSSATSAANSASAAATSETNAASSASVASTVATNASASASNAATSESNASTSETNAADSATAASGSATAAANSATAAANSATTAAASESKITNMTVSSQSVPYTQSAEVVKTEVGGAYNLDFKIPRGEPTSGHDVEANPSGAATGDLTKFGIDGTIYNVSGNKHRFSQQVIQFMIDDTPNITGFDLTCKLTPAYYDGGSWNKDVTGSLVFSTGYVAAANIPWDQYIPDMSWTTPPASSTYPSATDSKWTLNFLTAQYYYDDTTVVGYNDDGMTPFKDMSYIPILDASGTNVPLIIRNDEYECPSFSKYTQFVSEVNSSITYYIGDYGEDVPNNYGLLYPSKYDILHVLVC